MWVCLGMSVISNNFTYICSKVIMVECGNMTDIEKIKLICQFEYDCS